MINKTQIKKEINDFISGNHLKSPTFLLDQFYTAKPDNSLYKSLGDDFYLRPIKIENEQTTYYNLYKGEEKVCDEIFRKSGISSKFKDGYCHLIHFEKINLNKIYNVIIDHTGKIVLNAGMLDYPNHIKGRIATLKDWVYDLKTGEKILPIRSCLTGLNYMIVEHRYNWDSSEPKFELGIYKIEYNSAKLTKIDDIYG